MPYQQSAIAKNRVVSPHRDRLLAAVDTIRDVLTVGADEAQQLGHLPDSSVEALRDHDLYAMKTAAVVGGLELDPLTFMEVLESVARIDGSTSWALMVGNGSSQIASSRLSDEAVQTVYGGSRPPVTAGTTLPGGTGRPVDGGLRVDGRWAFGSGAPNAEWISSACTIDGTNPPEIRFFAAPRHDVTIIDNWQAVGLCGSGSGDYQLDDVFVPQAFIFQGDTPLRGGPLFHVPNLLTQEHIAVALGVAEHALDELHTLATRTRRADTAPLGETPAIQAFLGRSRLQLDAARALIVDTVGRTWDTVCAGQPVSATVPQETRATAAYITDLALEVATGAFRAAGGVAVYRDSPLQRCLADLNVAAQHTQVSARRYEDYGRALLTPPDAAAPATPSY